jgi:lipopolysaccharide biosynthesis regulator YciM
MLKYNPKNKYQCQNCKEYFRVKYSLIKHMKGCKKWEKEAGNTEEKL